MSMIEEKNNKWYSNKKVLVSLITVLLVLVVGMAFAYYFAILKGENVNTALTGGASLIYTEPTNGVETIQAFDYAGMTNENSYDFSISAHAANSTLIDYAIYLEEEEGNTISPSDVRVYLTDENNVPYSGYFNDIASAYFDDGEPYGSLKQFVDSKGNIGLYETVYDEFDYTITNSDDVKEISSSARGGVTPKQVFFQFYADSLGLSEGDYLYIQELYYDDATGIEQEVCIQYQYDNYGREADYNIVDASECSVYYGFGEDDTMKLISIDDFSTIYTMTKVSKDMYTTIFVDESDDIKYNGTIEEYIAKEQLKLTEGNSFYLGTSFLLSDEYGDMDTDFSKYCNLYNIDDDGNLILDDIVSNSYCEDSYSLIDYKAHAVSLGEFDEKFKEEGLKNVIDYGSYQFHSGTLTQIGKGDLLEAVRAGKSTRQFKLRYWISDNASIGIEGENQEVDVTTDTTENGNFHTVDFDNSGVFKFKVNVFAKQSNLQGK